MFDITSKTLHLDCPKCKTKNPFTLGQTERGEKLKCSGCGVSIVLSDGGSIKRASETVNRSLKDLEDTISNLNRKLTIKI